MSIRLRSELADDVVLPDSTHQQLFWNADSNQLSVKSVGAIVTPIGSGVGDVFNVARYAPGGLLTFENFEDALTAAIAAAYAAVHGGTVLIPVGLWPMTEMLLLPTMDGRGLGREFILAGAGTELTSLVWPDTFTGICVSMDGSTAGPDQNTFFCEIRDLRIVGNVSSAQLGLQVVQCIYTRFSRLEIGPVRTGLALAGTGGPSQNLHFSDVWLSGCQTSLVASNVNTTHFDHLLINQNQPDGSEIVLGGLSCDIEIHGGMLQSGGTVPSITTVNPNPGGIRFVITDFYHEGNRPVLLKTFPPTLSADYLEVSRFEAGGYDTLFDVDGTHLLDVGQIRSAPDTKYLIARNSTVNFHSLGPDPDLTPEWYDLDIASRASLSVNTGGKIFQGSSSAARSITGLLTPYAVEIFDPSIASKRTLSGGRVQSLTGLLNGSTWDAPGPQPGTGASRQPLWNASDPAFNNRPTFSCVQADYSMLFSNLTRPVAIGEHAGLFVVCRWTGTSTNGVNCVVLGDYPDFRYLQSEYAIGWHDGTTTPEDAVHYVARRDAATDAGAYSKVPGKVDATQASPHACLLQATSARSDGLRVRQYLYVDEFDSQVVDITTNQFPAAYSLGKLWMGFSATDTFPTISVWPSIDIAYCAVLKSGMSEGEVRQLMDMARERWGIG
jgi:hypothetical protein